MNAPWSLDNRMTVVLFAGMGGGCDGLEAAGYHVHLAINHDPVAVAVHEKRHPHTKHLRCDVFEVDPRQATLGRGVRVLHASPDCTHFSVAKGSKPVSKRRRSLAWVICRWAGTVRPEVITMENVAEIKTWGPLIAKRDPATGRVLRLDGTVAAKGERVSVEQQWLVPDPRHKGRIWRTWALHMANLGYDFEHKTLICADFGIATIRKRFFGVARCDGLPIVWPERTHAPRDKAKAMGLKPWVGAHTIIDWSLPVKSIFGRKKTLADATLRRTARGVMRYVVNAAKPFIVPITHAGADRVHSVDDPLRTLTTAHRGELSVVAPHVTKFRNGSTGADMVDPLPTFTANSFEKRPGGAVPLGIVGATIVGAGGRAAQSQPRDMEDPLGSSTTKEDRVLVAASLIQSGYGERPGQAPRTLDIEEPAGTVVAGGGKVAVVAAHLAKFNQNGDGKMPDAPLDTVMAGAPRHAVVSANLVGLAHGDSGGRREYDVDEPLTTVAAQGGNAALVASFLAQHNTGLVGRSADEPLSTIVTLGSTQGVVAASMAEMRGASKGGRDILEPTAAITAGGGHAHLILAFLQHYFGSGKQDDDVRQPIGALTSKARYGLVEVKVGRETFYIDDIGMRMLEPEEGAAAHGFAKGALPDEITVEGKTRRLTKTEKYHLVGNSVPPRMIELLARANVRPELMVAAE